MTRGVVGSLLVLLGGLVVATIPSGYAVAGLLQPLRGSATGRMLGLVVVLVGLGMVASAWLRLCRLASSADEAGQSALLARVRAATVAWSLPLLLAPPLFSRDGWSYAVVALSPVVHLWYLLWAVPFLAVQRLGRGATVALVAVSLVGGMVAPMDSSLHGAYLAIVIGSLVVAAVAVVLLVTRRARERLSGIATEEWTASIDATVVDQG